MRSLTPVAASLALCALVLPISIAGTNIALALLTAALLARARSDARIIVSAWRSEPVLAALIFYAAAGLLSAFASSMPADSVRDSMKDFHRLWALGLFTAALALEPEAPLRAAFGLSFSAMALTGIAQTAFGTRIEGALVRAHGFVHPVVFGEQMAVAALGGACVLLRPTLKASRGAATLFTALIFASLVLSQTRMALLSFLAGFAVVALLEPRARRWALPALLAVAAVAIAWEFVPNGGRTLSSLLAPYDRANPHQARWTLWNAAVRMFQDHPLLGVGPGGYHRSYRVYQMESVDGAEVWSSAHNLYLHQLAERGALGALALLALCATLFRRAARAARSDTDTRSLWAGGTIATLLAMSLTETTFHNEQFSTLILLVWAWGTMPLRARPERL